MENKVFLEIENTELRQQNKELQERLDLYELLLIQYLHAKIEKAKTLISNNDGLRPSILEKTTITIPEFKLANVKELEMIQSEIEKCLNR